MTVHETTVTREGHLAYPSNRTPKFYLHRRDLWSLAHGLFHLLSFDVRSLSIYVGERQKNVAAHMQDWEVHLMFWVEAGFSRASAGPCVNGSGQANLVE